MAYKLTWSLVARDDLRDLVRFIAQDHPQRAATFGLEVIRRAEIVRSGGCARSFGIFWTADDTSTCHLTHMTKTNRLMCLGRRFVASWFCWVFRLRLRSYRAY